MAVTENVRTLVQSLSELLDGHLRLFKLELAEDAKVVGIEVGKVAVLAPLLLVGYGFVCVALALFLRRFIAADLAFLAVGVLNLAVAAVGIGLAVLKLKKRQWLGGTAHEVSASVALLTPRRKLEEPHAS